jgi:hypothetical protein
MPGFDNSSNLDFIADNPWATVSGLDSWQDDYTRFRSGDIMDTTYSGVDTIIGRVKTGRELDKNKY